MRNTSIPVPKVCGYYKTAGFEHLVMENMPGMTFEEAWPVLDGPGKESIAAEVLEFVKQLRALQSPNIQATYIHRLPLKPGLASTADFNLERFSQLPSNEHISQYVQERTTNLHPQPNVYTHGDLDWSNILVQDGRVSGIIDWESSGYFPDYWEWVTLKRSVQMQGPNSWSHLLLNRMESSWDLTWDSMWELEQLHKALERYAQRRKPCPWADYGPKFTWARLHAAGNNRLFYLVQSSLVD